MSWGFGYRLSKVPSKSKPFNCMFLLMDLVIIKGEFIYIMPGLKKNQEIGISIWSLSYKHPSRSEAVYCRSALCGRLIEFCDQISLVRQCWVRQFNISKGLIIILKMLTYIISLQEEKVKCKISQHFLSIDSNLECIWQNLSSRKHSSRKASLRMSWLGKINWDV